ncbi:MAG TPA: ABC transporter permease, partial [Thermoanaerobaculia bacterium]|nr:ABC transporter permease [Thermoanaerobaculia bacterium]
MRSTDKMQLRLRSLFLRPRVEAELDAELAFHIDQLTAEHVAAGMSPREARHAAMREFGGVTQIQERVRDTWGIRWLEQLLQDLGFALRTFRRSPTLTLVALLSLALGIGANTAIFSMLNAFLLRPLPVHDPAGLVAVGDPTRVHDLSEGTVRTDLFSYPLYRELRERNRVFTGMFASGDAGRLTVGDASAAGAETVRGRLVSGNFFAVLAVDALLGRTFTEADDRAPGAAPYVVLSHRYWERRFAADPRAVGQTLTLNGHPFTIVGVTPPEFFGDVVGGSNDLWIPLSMQPQVHPGRMYLDRWDIGWLLLMGRLQPGASIERARAEMNTLVPRVLAGLSAAEVPAELIPSPDQVRIDVTPGSGGFSRARREMTQPLLMILAIVFLVLVVACANIANLLL